MSEDHRWSVGIGTALALVGSGLLLIQTALVVGAVIPLVYLLHGVVSTAPSDVELSATREFDSTGVIPGTEFTVTLTVENTGNDVLPDLRLIDGVPEELTVVAGTPRVGVALSPGERASTTYTVVLERGRFEFDDPVVRLRSLAGTDERTVTISAVGETTLVCADAISQPSLADATLGQAGTVPAETGGAGLEFYATRQYHTGDPMNRIDWHHVAKTGEFVTIQYRHERAVRSVVVVDCRPCTRVSYEAGSPTGAAMAAYAGERLFHSLESAGAVTNLTAVGFDGELEHLTDADGLPWLHPGADREHSPSTLFRGIHEIASHRGSADEEGPVRQRQAKEHDTGQTDDWTAAALADGGGNRERSEWTEKLLARLPAETQVILCSPVLDDWPEEVASELTDRECIVISPDVTAGSSYGQRIRGINRRRRLRRLQDYGAETANWRIDQSIEGTLKRALPELFTDR
ncbi:DUF58 domain-containing protein [Halobacteriaceae archaeon SHR40]|uniref:DUF58 domain-containing protein n=1 Tax=Halovenus amylolytica TaxID=2500550 RepID=UPI000FE31AB7